MAGHYYELKEKESCNMSYSIARMDRNDNPIGTKGAYGPCDRLSLEL